MQFRTLFFYILLGIGMTTILSLFGLGSFPLWIFIIFPIMMGMFFFLRSFINDSYGSSEPTSTKSKSSKKKKSSGLKIKW